MTTAFTTMPVSLPIRVYDESGPNYFGAMVTSSWTKNRLIVDWPQNAVPATIGPDKISQSRKEACENRRLLLSRRWVLATGKGTMCGDIGMYGPPQDCKRNLS